MSKSTTTAKIRKSAAEAARPEVGPLMPGRDILVKALEREGCEVIFAYPGGASM
jgi:acetolactate synthase-1/2/3 large subunit